jgi:hypothetical protein
MDCLGGARHPGSNASGQPITCAVLGNEFAIGLHQISQQRPDTDQARHRGPLGWRLQCLIVDQPFAHFHDVQIAVFEFPQLPWFQFVAAFECFGFHRRTDTRATILLRETVLQMCNEIIELDV